MRIQIFWSTSLTKMWVYLLTYEYRYEYSCNNNESFILQRELYSSSCHDANAEECCVVHVIVLCEFFTRL
jgi:hypothetical protein